MNRRTLIGSLSVGAFFAPALFSPTAQGHTLYGQWIVYRKKHLLIGCHRKDPLTFDLAKQLEAEFSHHLPEAKARVARAPHPERLASLLGTDQLEIAVLAQSDAEEMAEGAGKFKPYGKQPLTILSAIGERLLIAHSGFPNHHAWLARAAIDDAGLASATTAESVLPIHPGATMRVEGKPMPKAEEASE